MIKQFNFYKSYSDTICNLTHAEAGLYIKKMLEFMFREKELGELATDKVTSLLLLISDDLKEKKAVKRKGIICHEQREKVCFSLGLRKYFSASERYESGTFNQTGVRYMLGGSLVKTEDYKGVSGYFAALKAQLPKSKRSPKEQKRKRYHP